MGLICHCKWKKVAGVHRIVKGHPYHMHRINRHIPYWPKWRHNFWWSMSGEWIKSEDVGLNRWSPRRPSEWVYPFNGWGHRIGMNK